MINSDHWLDRRAHNVTHDNCIGGTKAQSTGGRAPALPCHFTGAAYAAVHPPPYHVIKLNELWFRLFVDDSDGVIVSSLTLTVKPLMFACPLFREVDESAKLKGANYDTTRR